MPTSLLRQMIHNVEWVAFETLAAEYHLDAHSHFVEQLFPNCVKPLRSYRSAKHVIDIDGAFVGIETPAMLFQKLLKLFFKR